MHGSRFLLTWFNHDNVLTKAAKEIALAYRLFLYFSLSLSLSFSLPSSALPLRSLKPITSLNIYALFSFLGTLYSSKMKKKKAKRELFLKKIPLVHNASFATRSSFHEIYIMQINSKKKKR